MNFLWRAAKIVRWALLLGAAFFFAMSMVYVDVQGDDFERYAGLFVACLTPALVVGVVERKLRMRAESLPTLATEAF